LPIGKRNDAATMPKLQNQKTILQVTDFVWFLFSLFDNKQYWHDTC
jgi:hypothetical protein